MIMVSGGFDPLHVGHLALLRATAQRGLVWAALNSDDWLIRKKGYRLMCWEDRAEILRELKSVYLVTGVEDSDGSVCEALRRLRPRFFANGGDRTKSDPREHKVCQELGITELFYMGGEKMRSSSELVRSVMK